MSCTKDDWHFARSHFCSSKEKAKTRILGEVRHRYLTIGETSMRRLRLIFSTIIATLLVFSSITSAWSAQQSAAPDTVTVSTVVSVEARHGKEVPVINNKED